jgi:hypothetical protein
MATAEVVTFVAIFVLFTKCQEMAGYQGNIKRCPESRVQIDNEEKKIELTKGGATPV